MDQIDSEKNEEQTLSKKEKKERKRERKQKERERRILMKKVKSIALWAVFIAVVIGGIYGLVVMAENSSKSRPGEKMPIVSREHINAGDQHEPYNSNPPTSGPHAEAALWGIKDEEIPDENAIHNLEHGGIWISQYPLCSGCIVWVL